MRVTVCHVCEQARRRWSQVAPHIKRLERINRARALAIERLRPPRRHRPPDAAEAAVPVTLARTEAPSQLHVDGRLEGVVVGFEKVNLSAHAAAVAAAGLDILHRRTHTRVGVQEREGGEMRGARGGINWLCWHEMLAFCVWALCDNIFDTSAMSQ